MNALNRTGEKPVDCAHKRHRLDIVRIFAHHQASAGKLFRSSSGPPKLGTGVRNALREGFDTKILFFNTDRRKSFPGTKGEWNYVRRCVGYQQTVSSCDYLKDDHVESDYSLDEDDAMSNSAIDRGTADYFDECCVSDDYYEDSWTEKSASNGG